MRRIRNGRWGAWWGLALTVGLVACQGPGLPYATALPATPAPTSTTQTLALSTPAQTPVPPTPIPGPARPLAWAEDGVMYLVHVASFYDSNGDGIGDLRGLQQKLDYLNDGDPTTNDDLGVNVLCLLPIFAAASSHGFDTLDHFAIRAEYGTRADLRDLVSECHRRGMKVVLQYVMGYVSDQQAFFRHAYDHEPSAYSDWFLWLDYPQTRYRTLDGVPTLPLLNGASEGVQEYALRVARYWMDLDGDGDCSDGVDGYLCDRPALLPGGFWERLRAQSMRLRPGFLLMASMSGSGQGVAASNEGQFDAVLDILVHSALVGYGSDNAGSVLGGTGQSDLITAALSQRADLYPQGTLCVGYLNTSDTDRIVSAVHGDTQRTKLAAVVLFALPGTPLLYYGEEIGMTGLQSAGQLFGSERCREPMDWYAGEEGSGMPTWFRPPDRGNRPGDGVSVQEQSADLSSLLSLYRRLIRLRTTHSALRSDGLERIPLVQDLPYACAYLRQDGQDRVLVVLNLERKPVEVSLQLSSHSLASGVWHVVDLLGDRTLPDFSGGSYALSLGAQEALVLELQRL